MRVSLRVIVAIALALAVSPGSLLAAGADPTLDVRIDVRVETNGPYITVARAVATQLYAAANVRLVWHDRVEPHIPVRQFTIVIVGSSVEMDKTLGKYDVLGRVVQPGVRAYVHYDRIVDLARMHEADPGKLLGQVIAHELCHLAGQGHSARGLMAPAINPRGSFQLEFSDEEARALHVRLAPPIAAALVADIQDGQ